MTTMTMKLNMLINGELLPSETGRFFDSINPTNGEVNLQLPDASLEDMKRAILSARKSFDGEEWRALSMPERGIFLKKIAKGIREQAKELARIESLDVGKTLKHSTFIDVNTCADTFEYFSNVHSELDDRINNIDHPVKSITAFEPMGVIGQVIPWNYPLIMAAWKIAPAIMAGNSVVLKPSPWGCASILKMGEIIENSQLPKGVVNIVSSQSIEPSQLLVESAQVDMISFTGGTSTGQEVMRKAAESLKKVSLELGGKSPTLVFADCDMEATIGGVLSSVFLNQGQMCTAGSRLLIEESIYDEFLTKLIDKTKALVVGDQMDYANNFGPLVNKEHRDFVLEKVKAAVNEGAKLVCGGGIPEGLESGAFIQPTILTEVTPSMSIVREEIFGPVLVVMKFKSIDEVIALANDSEFGLAASIWAKDKDKANTVARALQCGTVWINTYGGFYDGASFGGYKKSGHGRELGIEGLLEYTQSKNICIDETPGGKSLVTSWF